MSWKFSGIHYLKMVDININRYDRNGIEKIIDKYGILWLNEKYIEEGTDHKNLGKITTKYNSNYKIHTYEL